MEDNLKNMKNKFFIYASLIFGLVLGLGSGNFALGQANAGNGIHEPGTGIDSPELKQSGQATSTNRAGEVRSEVANTVHDLLEMADRNGGIGEQIRVVAQAQNKNQEDIKSGLEKIQSRSKFKYFFVGPDYKQIDNIKALLTQNREQLQQLSQIQTQLVNQGDNQKIQEQINTLEQINTSFENQINTTERGFSLLGWLFRIFR